MAIPVLFFAVFLFVAAARGQLSYLASNLETDIKGWFPWALAIVGVGALGAIPKIKGIAYTLLALIFTVLVISNRSGVFNSASYSPVSPPAAGPTPGTVDAAPAAAGGAVQTGTSALGAVGSQDATGLATTVGGAAGAISNIIPLFGGL